MWLPSVQLMSVGSDLQLNLSLFVLFMSLPAPTLPIFVVRGFLEDRCQMTGCRKFIYFGCAGSSLLCRPPRPSCGEGGLLVAGASLVAGRGLCGTKPSALVVCELSS